MMRMNNIKMSTTCKTQDVLDKLRSNRDQHAKIVSEARKGYVDKARAEVEKRLKQLETGQVVHLTFNLAPPEDYTTLYDTTISMLEMHQGDTIVLAADEFRQLVQDEWDFTDGFLASNARYSGTATLVAQAKNLRV